MGYSWAEAAEWDWVEYDKTVRVWSERQKPEGTDADSGETEPPSIEWMIEDDVRAHERGYKVH